MYKNLPKFALRYVYLPAMNAVDTSGLDIPAEDMEELLWVDTGGWLKEVAGIREYYRKFGDRPPSALRDEPDALEKRLVKQS